MPYSTHFEVTVPLAGTWVYQVLAIEETSESYKIPRNVIINNSAKNINYKLLAIDEAESDDLGNGIYLESGSKLQASDLNLYKIGIRFDVVEAGNETVIVSVNSFIKQEK